MKIERNCDYCGKKYVAGGPKSKYCSNAHRQRAYEQRSGKQAPSFITKEPIPKKVVFKPIQTPKPKEKESAISGNSFVFNALQKLQNDRNFYVQSYYSLKPDTMPYATVGGAIVGSMLFGKENRTMGAILLGCGGLLVDMKMIEKRTDATETLKQQIAQKIKEIDKQISLLKETELKEVSQPKNEKKVEWNNGILSSIAVAKQNIPSYEFTDPYSNFIGHPTQNFSAIIYGLPKSGKSNFSIQFSSYLAKHFGKVLYFASEEGLQSRTLIDKIKYNLAENKEIFFSGATELEQIKKDVKSDDYKFIFLDSINRSKITPEQLEELKSENKDKAFISILQSTKGGDFKGNQEFAHNCDVVINIADGIASQVGRFNGASQMNVFAK